MSDHIQLKSLQQGRGLAALAVVAFHLSILLQNPRYLGYGVFSEVTSHGYLGVDFFFVLSGFIIIFAHHADMNHPERLKNYLLKRFTRVFPAYWLYTAVFCILVGVGLGSAATFPQTVGNWISTIFLIRLDNFELPITPSWTLIHEVAFYLVFAVFILNRIIGSIIFSTWMLACILVFQYAPEGSRSALTTYFSPLNLNFLIGIGAYYAWKK